MTLYFSDPPADSTCRIGNVDQCMPTQSGNNVPMAIVIQTLLVRYGTHFGYLLVQPRLTVAQHLPSLRDNEIIAQRRLI